MRSGHSRERGSVLVLMVVLMVVLLGFVALTTDYGLLVVNKRQLQNATDAAALAAAEDLKAPAGDAGAKARAEETAYAYATDNASDSATTSTTFVASMDNSGSDGKKGAPFSAEVTATRSVATPFAKVMDRKFAKGNVRARSLVQVVPTRQLSRLRPWGIPFGFFNGNQLFSQLDFGDRVDLLFTNAGDQDPTSSGLKLPFLVPLALNNQVEAEPYDDYFHNITEGYDQRFEVKNNTRVPEQTGDLRSVTERGIRTDADASILGRASAMGDDGSKWRDPPADSPRLIFLPVIDQNVKRGGTVYGFAAFWVEDFSYPRLTGRFVRYSVPAEGVFPFSGKIEPEWYAYGVYSYRLVE